MLIVVNNGFACEQKRSAVSVETLRVRGRRGARANGTQIKTLALIPRAPSNTESGQETSGGENGNRRSLESDTWHTVPWCRRRGNSKTKITQHLTRQLVLP